MRDGENGCCKFPLQRKNRERQTLCVFFSSLFRFFLFLSCQLVSLSSRSKLETGNPDWNLIPPLNQTVYVVVGGPYVPLDVLSLTLALALSLPRSSFFFLSFSLVSPTHTQTRRHTLTPSFFTLGHRAPLHTALPVSRSFADLSLSVTQSFLPPLPRDLSFLPFSLSFFLPWLSLVRFSSPFYPFLLFLSISLLLSLSASKQLISSFHHTLSLLQFLFLVYLTGCFGSTRTFSHSPPAACCAPRSICDRLLQCMWSLSGLPRCSDSPKQDRFLIELQRSFNHQA